MSMCWVVSPEVCWGLGLVGLRVLGLVFRVLGFGILEFRALGFEWWGCSDVISSAFGAWGLVDPFSCFEPSGAKAIALLAACIYLAQYAASAPDVGLGIRV